MLVEPASFCWLAGRKAEARDGVTWAAELERWPALQAVVRDGGTGLSKGIDLVRSRRRAAAAAAQPQTRTPDPSRRGAEPPRAGPRRQRRAVRDPAPARRTAGARDGRARTHRRTRTG